MKNNLYVITLLSLLFSSNFSIAGLRPLDSTEMSDVSARNGIDTAILLQNDIRSFVKENNNQVSAEDIQVYLENRARILGLSLNDVSIKGISYGGVPMTIQLNGVDVTQLELPSHIDEIHVGRITVNNANPNNRSFGSLDIRNIDMTGTKIEVNLRTSAGH